MSSAALAALEHRHSNATTSVAGEQEAAAPYVQQRGEERIVLQQHLPTGVPLKVLHEGPGHAAPVDHPRRVAVHRGHPRAVGLARADLVAFTNPYRAP